MVFHPNDIMALSLLNRDGGAISCFGRLCLPRLPLGSFPRRHGVRINIGSRWQSLASFSNPKIDLFTFLAILKGHSYRSGTYIIYVSYIAIIYSCILYLQNNKVIVTTTHNHQYCKI